jgi:hypothetical protein
MQRPDKVFATHMLDLTGTYYPSSSRLRGGSIMNARLQHRMEFNFNISFRVSRNTRIVPLETLRPGAAADKSWHSARMRVPPAVTKVYRSTGSGPAKTQHVGFRAG